MAGWKFSPTELLDFYLHAQLSRTLKLDHFTTYAILSCAAGVVFIFLALLLSNLMGEEWQEKCLFFSVLATMGANQLFFGYIESYTLAYVGIMAYFLSCLRFLDGKCSLIFPSLVLSFSISLHLSALYLLPSLIYLCISKSKKERETLDYKSVFSVTSIILLLGAGLLILSTRNPNKISPATYFISLFGTPKDSYSFFSFAHVVDIVNEQLLLSPAGVILWAIEIFFARKVNLKDKVVIFLVIVTLFSFLFTFLMDPKLGYARDWDLFSSTGLGYTILGLYLVFAHFRRTQKKKLNYTLLALTVTALFSTLPWLYVNAQENKAVERFRSLLDVDVERSEYGHKILAYYYRDRGPANEEIGEWEKAFSVIPNGRYLGDLGFIYLRLGRYQEVANILRKAIQINPNLTESYCGLGIALQHIGEYDEAKKQYQIALEKGHQFLPAYVNLGGVLALIGDYQEALKVLNLAIGQNPDYFQAYYSIAVLYCKMGRTKDAITLLQAYLKRNPGDHQNVQGWLEKMNIDLDYESIIF